MVAYNKAKVVLKIVFPNNNTNNRWFLEHSILLKPLSSKDYRDNK